MKQFLLTNGRFKILNLGFPCLILFNTGAKTNIIRKTVLAYFIDQESYYIVASNGGSKYHPGWYFNLISNPQSKIKVGKFTYNVNAVKLQGNDREIYWKKINDFYNKRYDGYQSKTIREIAIFKLEKI
tara:strand:+ start:70 stop:453 length:384 start_codon:yes stop_codon:yes gene_type:complete